MLLKWIQLHHNLYANFDENSIKSEETLDKSIYEHEQILIDFNFTKNAEVVLENTPNEKNQRHNFHKTFLKISFDLQSLILLQNSTSILIQYTPQHIGRPKREKWRIACGVSRPIWESFKKQKRLVRCEKIIWKAIENKLLNITFIYVSWK